MNDDASSKISGDDIFAIKITESMEIRNALRKGLFEAQGEANTQRIATAHTELQSKIGEEGSSEYNRSMEMANRAMWKQGD